MKRLIGTSFLLALSMGCFGQMVNETKLKNMLIGKWFNADDSVLTVSISGDTLKESTGGEMPELDVYTYKILNYNCDSKHVHASPTGYYFLQTDMEDGECECGSIQKISPESITIIFPDDEMVLARVK